MIAPAMAASAPVVLIQAAATRRIREAGVERWQVDQVRVSPETPGATLNALGPDHSMAAVIARLKAMGVPFTRGRVGLLPDRMPPDLRDQIGRLPPGEPFLIPGRDYISINVILGRILPPGSVRFTPPAPRAPPLRET